jgi:hypothetical protein
VQRAISVNGGMPMPGWFDVHELGGNALDSREDPVGIKDSSACAPSHLPC